MPPGQIARLPGHSLEDELLQLLSRQGRRLPVPVFLAAAMMAWLARAPQGADDTVLAVWLLVVAAVLAVRKVVLGRLPGLTRYSLRQRLDAATALSGLNGTTHAAVLALPSPGDFPFAIQSLLLVGLCAGSVATTAGYRPVFLAYLSPIVGALVLRWVFCGAADGLAVAMIIALFAAVLVALAGDSFRLFRDSFDIRLEHVKLNERLAAALQQAEAANRAKTRFLAAASHDLRQPIHTVALFAAALSLQEDLSPKVLAISNHINEALANLTSQLDALLDISKLDAGVVPVRPATVPLANFFQRMHEEYGPIAGDAGVALTVDSPGTECVHTDELLLGRVVGNLLDNAIKYARCGEVSLTLACDAGLVTLIVADNGAGIPADEQERIFEEFYQLDNPERNRTKGLGLGLSIVKRLVVLLGARMEMASLPGHGTTFYLMLPAHSGQAAPAAACAVLPGSLAGRTVLVVDDEKPVREGMRALLERLGATVTEADGIKQALAVIDGCRPDLLLADLRLPGEDDGFALVREIRARLPNLPVILISGDTSPERLLEASEVGIPLLHKPPPIAELQRLAADLTANLPR